MWQVRGYNSELRICLWLPICCRIGDRVTSNNPLSQDGTNEPLVPPLGAALPPVLPTGAVTVGSVPITTQVLAVQWDAAVNLNQAITDQMAATKAVNEQIQQLLLKLQQAKAAGDTPTADKLQAQIDELTSQSQLDMIRLQSLVSKQQAAMETMSNMTTQFAATKDKIIGNMT
jgi:hypothetical protein